MKDRVFRKILITGISGSGGSYLAQHFLENHPEIEVHGTSRWHTSPGGSTSGKKTRAIIHETDLNDFSSVLSVLREVRPQAIFHLASFANVRASFTTPLAVLNNNILGTANLFEAIRAAGINPVLQLASTSEVYGDVDPKNVPIKEDCPINPVSPYAVSKTAQDLLAHVYYRSYGLKIIRTRMFTYINPRRSDLFATSFALQVARIEAGLGKELRHGNLDSIRTVIDVRDAMAAYYLATTRGRFGEIYNIGGTKTISVGEFLALLKKLSTKKIISRLDPSLLRPADVTLQIPDTTKFVKETHFRPKYTFEESVAFLLSECRNQVAAELVRKGNKSQV